MTQFRETQVQQHPADSMVGERLWNALFSARAGGLPRQVADLEDAVFNFICRWPAAWPIPSSASRRRIGCRPNKPQNSVWRAPSWNGRGGRVAGFAGQLDPRS